MTLTVQNIMIFLKEKQFKYQYSALRMETNLFVPQYLLV